MVSLSLSEMGFLGFDFFFSAGSSDREKMEKNHTHITVELDASLDGITAREKKSFFKRLESG